MPLTVSYSDKNYSVCRRNYLGTLQFRIKRPCGLIEYFLMWIHYEFTHGSFVIFVIFISSNFATLPLFDL